MSGAIDQVVSWMLEGHGGHDIIQAITEKFPYHKPAELLTGSGKHFEQVATADPALLRGWCLEATRDLYKRLLDVGDYPNALRAVKQMRDFTN